METLLHEAIQFAKEHVAIIRKDVEVISQAQKSVFYSNGEPWVKSGGGSFDVTMGAYDGAEVYERSTIQKILRYIEMTEQPHSKM